MDTHDRELAELATYEDGRRASADFATLAPATVALGANPYRVERLPGANLWVGIERGTAQVVLLDEFAQVVARVDAPRAPTALAVGDDGLIYVGGASPDIAVFKVKGAKEPHLVAAGHRRLDGITVVRALATAPGVLYGVDLEAGTIASQSSGRDAPSAHASCRAPIDIVRHDDRLLVDCLVDHSVLVWHVSETGLPTGEPVTIHHDGPIWSMAAASGKDGALSLALGGVEDHPLERKDGGFGYIDSFLFVYQLDGDKAARRAAVNLSELGVVTPKWVGLAAAADGGLTATAAGYGAEMMATVAWPSGDLGAAPTVTRRELLPGLADLSPGTPTLAADPLVDAWVAIGDEVTVVKAPPPPASAARTVESRIGEALMFTRLMAPWNTSEGKRSRFTCETCHFEGGIDGRVHYTGRGTVHSATKPLIGLFSNRPHFTRALDKTMAQMVNNEFGVANRFSGHDAWFTLDASQFAWLRYIDGTPRELSPPFLRRSLMAFMMDFNREPNWRAQGKAHFTAVEKHGAELFRDRCASCHAARLVTDRADSEVPFERWESLVLSPTGPLTWASAEYQKTGVEPYVNDDGARTTSLRRLARKQPYFTNGSALSVDDVLRRSAWQGERFFHDKAPDGASHLGDDERAALTAFLALL